MYGIDAFTIARIRRNAFMVRAGLVAGIDAADPIVARLVAGQFGGHSLLLNTSERASVAALSRVPE